MADRKLYSLIAGIAKPISDSDIALVGQLRVKTNLVFTESGGTDTITITAPSIGSPYTLTLPVDDGTSGQVLQTDGSGNLSWLTLSSGTLTGLALNEEHIIIGNASDLSAAVDTGALGDILATTAGGLQIKTGVIVDADVNASAAIARSKLASGTANRVVVNDGSGVMSDAAAITADRALISDANGIPTHSTTTATELGYVSGVTSAIQTQLNAKADDADVIKKDGSVTFTGNQPMGGFKLTGLAAGSTSGDSVRYEQAILVNGANAFTADQSMGGNKITSLGAPSASTDAATKAYVDSVAEGLKPKQAVRVATTASITIASDLNVGDTIDGVTLAAGDRVLVKDQATPSQNGIYIAGATPARSTDFDSLTPIDEINGAYVAVQEGTANAGKIFVQQGDVSTLDTDPINFVFFNSSSSLVGGDGITISGSNISVDHDGQGLQFVATQLALELDGSTLSKSATGVKVADGGITDTQVNASAAIARSKLAAGAADHVIINDGSGNFSSEAQLAMSRGGTNKAMTAAAGAVVYSDADSLELTSVGATGQVLKSNGTSAPAFAWNNEITEDRYVAGEALALGDIVILRAPTVGGDLRWWKASAAAADNADADLNKGINKGDSEIIGVAKAAAASAGDPVQVIMQGEAVVNTTLTAGASFDKGSNVFLSASVGGAVATAAPSADGDQIVRLGKAVLMGSAGTARIYIKATWVGIA